MATILVDIFNCIFLNNDGNDVGNLQYEYNKPNRN